MTTLAEDSDYTDKRYLAKYMNELRRKECKLAIESSRRGTRASSSSKKMTQGEDDRARANTCLTALSLSPTYFLIEKCQSRNTFEKKKELALLSNSGPLTEIKFARLSFATAFAKSVLPQPGGPQSKTPLGASIPTTLNSSGCRIGCTMAMCSSSRVWLSAPISDQVTSGMVAKPSRLAEGWTIFNAARKSAGVREMVESWSEVRAVGWDMRNLAMGVFLTSSGRLANGVSRSSIAIASIAAPSGSEMVPCSLLAAGSVLLPVPLSKMRLTAMTPASVVSAVRSAPM